MTTTQTQIKHVYGNKFSLAIPLNQIVRTLVDGQEVEIESPFYPKSDSPVMVVLAGSIKTYKYEAVMVDNVATITDLTGQMEMGMYNVSVLCQDQQGNPCRFMVRCAVQIVSATKDAGIEAGIEFDATTYTLDGAVFFYAKGDKGDPGEAGVGIADGGTTGQFLQKKSDDDYDTEWADLPTDNVLSVNGKTGEVNLDASDVGALPDDTPIPKEQIQSDWNQSDNTQKDFIKNKPSIPSKLSDLDDDATHRVVTDTEKTTWNNKSDFSGSYNDLTNKPTIPTVPTNVSAFINDAGYITKTVNDLVNYYLKSDIYTKTEVQQLISAIQQFTYQVVSSLPTASADTMNIIYLVPSADPQTQNVKDEYITIDNGAGATTRYTWEQIGSTAIDLSGYYTSQQTDAAITAALNTVLADYTTTAALTLLLATKQDVINDLATIRSGASAGATAYQKPQTGIPSTDMSSAVQTSLGKADTALQSQVQANWNETDTDDASFIKNKPTIPAAQVNSDWNASSGVAKILNKPDLSIYVVSTDLQAISNNEIDTIWNNVMS